MEVKTSVLSFFTWSTFFPFILTMCIELERTVERECLSAVMVLTVLIYLAKNNKCKFSSTVKRVLDKTMLIVCDVSCLFCRFRHDVNFTLCRSDERTQDNRTHQNGYNPHCLFLCLLGSIAFDATVLLDFLISSETCFLEYFVQYLKLLVEDWHQFVQVSQCFKFTVGKDLRIWGENLPCQQEKVPNSDLTGPITAYDTRPSTEALLLSSLNLSTLRQGDSQAIQPNHFDFVTASSDPRLLGSFQKLVDYDSSEDSDVECVREERLTDTEQEALNYRACLNKAVLDEKAKTSEQEGLLFIEQDLNISSDSGSKLSPPEFKLADETFQKATACFQQLQKSVSRLHAKGLFPYNPNALLKLLNQVHLISDDRQAVSD